MRPIDLIPTAIRRALTAAALGLLLAPAAEAQYFGQNKVQYERFDFQVLRTEHFDIYHYPEEADAVRIAARMAEQWRARLSESLGFTLRGRQPLVLYASHPHFVQTQVIQGQIGEGTGGVTEALQRRMVMPFASTLGETSHVLGHELVHAFQYDAGGERVGALPLWFIEGMAEFLTLGYDDAHTAMWLRDLVREEEELPGLEDLANPRFFPYRFGHAAWAYLASRFGLQVVGEAYVNAARAGDPIAGIEAATGVPLEELNAGWHAALRERHGRRDGSAPGRVVVAGDEDRGGRLNVSPSISPDGTRIAYLSERGLFSIDLYVADAESGRIIRRLTKTETDPHIESLQFVGSAGAWDRTSRRFAFTTVRGGKATITVADIGEDGGGTSRDFEMEDVDEAWHTTWAPDGSAIAFAGLAGGVSDLYVLDLKTGAIRRLTSDAYADLQPAWSPDGRQLAFVTERFSSSTERLAFGEPRLALLTLATGAVEALPSLPAGKHINPQWDGDGGSLFFIGAPDGVPDVYRLTIGSRTAARLTAAPTGVTGITALSPALSYAPAVNRLAFSVFRDGGYEIRLSEPQPVAGDAAGDSRASLLFPPAAGETVAALETIAGAPATDTDTSRVEPYKPSLALDFAGASGGVGVAGSYGAFVGGGLGLQFSDVLGDHTLTTIIQANGSVRDIGGQVVYLNRASRWNWGGAASYLPYVTGSFGQGIQVVNGQSVLVDQEYLFRQTDADLRALTFYPFSRAMRIEFQAGARRIWFDRELTTRLFSLQSGSLLDETREEFAAPDALTLGEGTAALVYDQSVFGPTSPITGQRYRFEVTPTVGSLRFTNVLLDFRRYLPLVRPFTLAVRGLHVGRYGSDAEDGRLSPLFLGYPSLVRGYDVGTFDADECGTTADGSCPAFDELLGSRVAVGNAELRFPLIGAFRGRYDYGPLPIEGFLFADAGVAWTSDVEPAFTGGDRPWVGSVGAGLRVNAFGFAVVEFSAARPVDRPGRRGWVFGFNLIPGF
jgi:Tol biopolymer transport system component